MFDVSSQIQTTTDWLQVAFGGGLLCSVLGGLLAAARWVGKVTVTIEEVRKDVKEINASNKAALDGFAKRLDPLEQDYWERRGSERARRRAEG